MLTVMLGLAVLPAVRAQAAGQVPVAAIGSTTVAAPPGPAAAALAAAGDAYVPVKPATLATGIRAKPGAPGVVTVRGRSGVPAGGTAGAGVTAVVLQVVVSGASSAGCRLCRHGAAGAGDARVSPRRDAPLASSLSQSLITRNNREFTAAGV